MTTGTLVSFAYLLNDPNKAAVKGTMKLLGATLALWAAYSASYKIEQQFTRKGADFIQENIPESIENQWDALSPTTQKVILFIAGLGMLVAGRTLSNLMTGNFKRNPILAIYTVATTGKDLTQLVADALKALVSLKALSGVAGSVVGTLGIRASREAVKDVPILGKIFSKLLTFVE